MIENNNHKLKSADWQGYVRRALEDMGRDIKDIKEDIESMNKKISNNRVKIAGLGASVSFAVTLLVILLKEIILK